MNIDNNKQTVAVAVATARALGLAAALLGSVLPASAGVVVYTSQASFQAALGATPAVDGFSDLTVSPTQEALTGPLSRSVAGLSYRASAVGSSEPAPAGTDFYVIAPGGNVALSGNFPDASLVFDQFSQPLRGLAGQFSTTDQSGSIGAGSLTFQLLDAGGTFSYTLASGSAPSFLGFLSDSNITSLSLSAAQGGFNFATVDNLALGAAVSAVPEPGAISLAVLGLGLLGLASRRKRNP